MADKKAQALERLTAKLSALRKTLRGEERILLDAMVLAAQTEVSAHSKVVKPIARPTARPSARINQDSDVELHQARSRKTPGPASQKQLGADGRTFSDVELHSASVRRIQTEAKTTGPSARKTPGPEASKVSEAEGRQFLRIQLNDGNYRVTIL